MTGVGGLILWIKMKIAGIKFSFSIAGNLLQKMRLYLPNITERIEAIK